MSDNALNHNPNLGYRRLGKTGLMVSEIGLGGHGGKMVEDRVGVLKRAAELGLNYLDTPTAEECDLHGRALGKDRDRWIIGFASWPEKLTADFEAQLTPDLLLANIDARLKSYRTDMLDLWRPVAATWASWDKAATGHREPGEVTAGTLEKVVNAFEKARKQGKVRFLGISGHNPALFRRILTEYPQFSVILFPYTFATRASRGGLLSLAQEKDVGAIGIKPLAAGAGFGDKQAVLAGQVDPRAPSLLKAMLQEERLSALVPGILLPGQLEQNAKASYTRNLPLTDADRRACLECLETYRRQLNGSYAGYGWLRDWEVV